MTPEESAEYLLWHAYKIGFERGSAAPGKGILSQEEVRCRLAHSILLLGKMGQVLEQKRILEALAQPIFIPFVELLNKEMEISGE